MSYFEFAYAIAKADPSKPFSGSLDEYTEAVKARTGENIHLSEWLSTFRGERLNADQAKEIGQTYLDVVGQSVQGHLPALMLQLTSQFDVLFENCKPYSPDFWDIKTEVTA